MENVGDLSAQGQDVRYVYVVCPVCGEVYQVMDWGCEIHRMSCSRVEQGCGDLFPSGGL